MMREIPIIMPQQSDVVGSIHLNDAICDQIVGATKEGLCYMICPTINGSDYSLQSLCIVAEDAATDGGHHD